MVYWRRAGEVVTNREFEEWYTDLEDDPAFAVTAAVEVLEQDGPALGRPLVDTIGGSRFPNMKELRVTAQAHELRILFVFDPRRRAVLLLGGDKTGRWRGWYRTAIPEADALYERWLRDLDEE